MARSRRIPATDPGHGVFDNIKDAAEKAINEHPEQIADALDKVTDVADDRTGGKHHDQIEQADAKAREFLEKRSTPGA